MEQLEIIARNEAEAHPRVYSFKFDEEPELIFKHEEIDRLYSTDVHIMRGAVNGVLAYKIWKRISGAESSVYDAYYCEDPDQAGVTRFQTSVLDDFFAA